MSEKPKFIVVIGTSAGGVAALSELVAQFDQKMDAAFFIVMHLSNTAISDFLIHRLQPVTDLKCLVAADAMPVQKGHIYIAPPNQHLILIRDQIVVGQGPRENSWRPSIDVLFRSAAAAYNSRVIGIILTGFLNDGTAGMMAVKQSGGVCIVQDPNEAEFPDMPLSVLNNLEADYSISLACMGEILSDLMEREPKAVEPPHQVVAEADIAARMAVGMEKMNGIGKHSVYNCPDCGGGLWQISGEEITRYRCYTGHTYNENELLAKLGDNVESTLWVAVRMMEERSNMYTKIAQDHRKKGLVRISDSYNRNADELKKHIDTLRDVLGLIQKSRIESKEIH
jgi:two-component system, chemotaxis family, protein-glutamate methylesterase/glutaminase